MMVGYQLDDSSNLYHGKTVFFKKEAPSVQTSIVFGWEKNKARLWRVFWEE